jgi:hypothetical protein
VRGRERTPQQLDPVGTLAGLPMVPLFSAVAIGYAIFSTASHGSQVSHPSFAFAAILVLIASAVVFVVVSRPALAPLGLPAHVCIIGLALVASILFTMSVWGTNKRVQDDWGQIAVALLLIAMALFRPPVEVIVSGLVCALVLGGVGALEAPFLIIKTNPLVYATVTATPVVALACAAAAYSLVMTTALTDWQSRASEAIERLEPEVRAGEARVVHQEQVTLLNEAAVPFLAGLLERDAITESDISRAREIAEELRVGAMADYDRGWLSDAVDRTLSTRSQFWTQKSTRSQIRDPGRLAEHMVAEQRGTLSAFIVALARARRLEEHSLSIDVEPAGDRCSLVLTAHVDSADRSLRSQLIPYLSVLRAISSDARLRVRAGTVTLSFVYDK